VNNSDTVTEKTKLVVGDSTMQQFCAVASIVTLLLIFVFEQSQSSSASKGTERHLGAAEAATAEVRAGI
jgi:hypothetical protein